MGFLVEMYAKIRMKRNRAHLKILSACVRDWFIRPSLNSRNHERKQSTFIKQFIVYLNRGLTIQMDKKYLKTIFWGFRKLYEPRALYVTVIYNNFISITNIYLPFVTFLICNCNVDFFGKN